MEKPGEETGLQHTTTLQENREFRRTYYKGKSCTTSVVVLYVLKNHRKQNRIGLTATKKVGGAVERNRARRVLREAYRLLEEQFPVGYDYVFVARTKTAYVKTPEVMRAMQSALRKLDLK